jgi:hypothetical protein
MGQHHIRVALQRLVIMTGKPIGARRCHQQCPGLARQHLRTGRRQRLLRLQHFIHLGDELRHRAQPRKPRIRCQQMQELIRRRDPAERFFIAHTFRFYQRLVQGPATPRAIPSGPVLARHAPSPVEMAIHIPHNIVARIWCLAKIQKPDIKVSSRKQGRKLLAIKNPAPTSSNGLKGQNQLWIPV